MERIRDFLLIEQEPLPTEQGTPPAYWPSSGNIKADHLCAQYSKGMTNHLSIVKNRLMDILPDGPLVLQDISFDIKSGERVGIGLFIS